MLRELLGFRRSSSEVLRKNLREIERAIRTLTREGSKFQSQEKSQLAELKKCVKDGKMDLAKVVAKDLVRIRGSIRKFTQLTGHLRAIKLKLQVMSSNVQMASTVKGVSGLLATVNRTMNPLEIQRSIQQFQLQNQKIGLAEEMFTEAIEGTMEDIDDLGEADEDAEEIIKKVFEEVNLQIKQSLPGTATEHGARDAEPAVDNRDQLLESRIEDLKK